MARRKKNNYFIKIMYVFLIFIIIFLLYKINEDKNKNTINNSNNSDNNIIKDNTSKVDDTKKEESINEKKEENKKEITNTNSNEVTTNSSNDEKTENRNEKNRRGGTITLDLIGEEMLTIKEGSNYIDEGVKAYYSDGTDASNEVDVDNAVDASKKGTYTVTYYAGNSIVIRRVTVE